MISRKTTIFASLATFMLLGVGVAAAASDATASGARVSYAFDPATGTISHYASLVDGAPVTIFERVSLATWNASNLKQHAFGPLALDLDGKDAQIATFDAKNAALFVRSSTGNTVTLVVADGINLTSYAGEPGWAPAGVKLTMGNATARLELHGAGNVSVDGQTITVVLGEKAHMSFRIVGHPGEWTREHAALHKIAARARRSTKG